MGVHCSDRRNGLEEIQWRWVMDGLEGNTFISSFNGVDGLENLFKGGQEEADLRNKNLDKYEAVVPVARLLLRSEATLTKLDLRYCSQEQNMC